MVHAPPWDDRFANAVRSVMPGVGTLTEETPLRDGGLNSLGCVQLIMTLETAFDVDFPDDLLRVEAFDTAGGLWRTLATLL